MTAKFTKGKRHVKQVHASKVRITAGNLGRRASGKAAGKPAGSRTPHPGGAR